MRSPADMKTIQIDITNACTERCSNCTRFCGNHKKPFFMDFETFKRAVDSLDGYDGVRGIMGGEPTLHPKFEQLVEYLQSKFGKRKEPNRLLYPQQDFIQEIRRREFESGRLRTQADGCRQIKDYGLALFSNMNAAYLKYYELIQDTFHVQYLNDHINPSYHQPGLVSRKDLGIPDDEWVKLRDKCWVQEVWSASITPKGAFFCEVAGALDMLFDGPGGWKIEPGWWKRTPEEFGDQLHWCELCGFALDTFMRDAKDEVDDVSPTLYEMLKEVDSPGLKSRRTNLLKIDDGVIAEESKIYGRPFEATPEFQPYLEHYEDRFNSGDSVLFSCQYNEVYIPEGKEFGKELNKVLKGDSPWVLYKGEENVSAEELKGLIGSHVFNPGVLHIGREYAFFNRNASSLKKIGFDRVAVLNSIDELIELWEQGKVISIKDKGEKTKLKKESICVGKRYAIWGTGEYGNFLADVVIESGGELVYAVDKDSSKEGTEFKNIRVNVPEYLVENIDEFDVLIIANYAHFDEIYQQALQLGIPEEKLRMPYEVI